MERLSPAVRGGFAVTPGEGRPEPSADELFATGPSASPAEIEDAVSASMGLDMPARPRPAEYPLMRGLAQELGLLS